MSISSIHASRSDEPPRPSKGIIGEDRVRRLRIASKRDELIIRESVALVLGAEEDLLTGYEEMTEVPFESDEPIPYDPTGSTPLMINEPVEIIIKSKAGSSRKPPEHSEDIAKWDALVEEIQEKIFDLRSSIQILH